MSEQKEAAYYDGHKPMRQVYMKRFVAYGEGFSGDYDTIKEAADVVCANERGAVYVRLDHVMKLAQEVRVAFDSTAARLVAESLYGNPDIGA